MRTGSIKKLRRTLTAVVTVGVIAGGLATVVVMGRPASGVSLDRVVSSGDDDAGSVSVRSHAPTWRAATFGVATAGLNRIAVASGHTAWAWSDTGTFRWDGRRWSPSRGPRGITVEDAVTVSPHEVWAAGSALSASAQTAGLAQWNGTRWVSHVVPSSMRLPGVDPVLAVRSDRQIWLADVSDTPPHSDIVVAFWNGHRFTRLPSPTIDLGDCAASQVTGAAAVSNSQLWLLGTVGTAACRGSQPYALRWDGHAWRAASLPATGAEGGLRGLVVGSGGTLWGYGFDAGRPLLLTCRGGVWHRVALTAMPAPLTAGVGDGDGGLWLAGGTGRDLSARGYLLHVTDSGTRLYRAPASERASRDAGYRGTTITSLALVPGTHTVWAAGSYGNADAGGKGGVNDSHPLLATTGAFAH